MTEDHPELRASDADRDRVAEVLRDALAEGRLDMDEFEERLEAAYRARTYGELAPLTRDLPAAATASLSKAPGAAPAGDDRVHWPARIGGTPTSRRAFALWSGFRRRAAWTVPRRFLAFALWGGGEIDLREAHFEGEDVEIRCIAVMGGIQVVAPPELTVRVTGVGVFGGFDDGATGPGSPGSPQVTITGLALMGGVVVERKMRRAQRERLKEERRAERAQRRADASLPADEDRRDRQLGPAQRRDRHGHLGGHGHGHGRGHGRGRSRREYDGRERDGRDGRERDGRDTYDR